jgi:hypothetical protein
MSAPISHPSNISPWHAGELAVQRRLGVDERMALVGPRAIRPYMIDEHRAFFAMLEMIFVGSLDADGNPWASVLSGPKGFLNPVNYQNLTVGARPAEGDPLGDGLAPGARLGLLGLDLTNRRRNRLNGRVSASGADGFTVTVDQSFGNCPKYIQTRRPLALAPGVGEKAAPEAYAALTARDRRLIAAADTFFLATASGPGGEPPNDGVDISHRGGLPGFVTVEDDGRLIWPDYSGNRFFNTLGNIAGYPKAGLQFFDWERGDALLVSGEAQIVWDGAEVAARRGAERLVAVTPRKVRYLPRLLPRRWKLAQTSEYLTRM